MIDTYNIDPTIIQNKAHGYQWNRTSQYETVLSEAESDEVRKKAKEGYY